MFKTIGWMLLSILGAMLIATLVTAAESTPAGKTVQRFEVHGDVWMVPELGALITSENGIVAVKMAAPAEHLPKEYQTVDLKTGDQVLMVNGKKVNSPKDLGTAYDALAVGGEFKLGIKRDGEMQIVSFKKADPSTLPKRQMVIKGGPGDGNGTESSNSHSFNIDPNAKNVTPLNDARIVVGEKDAKVVVLNVLPGAEQLYAKGGFKEGDVVISIQGKPLGSANQFSEALDALKIGAPVKVVVDRNGKQVTVAFDKSKSTMRTLIQRQ